MDITSRTRRPTRSKAGKKINKTLYGILMAILIAFGYPFLMDPNPNSSDLTQHSVTGDHVLRVIFLDVGQGASQLIISPSGKTMLIDGGDNDQKENMVKYLQQYGVQKLDIVVATHPDADHIGGLSAVIDYAEVDKIYMPKVQTNTKTFETLLKSIQNKGLKITTAKAGITLDLDPKLDIQMVGPARNGLDNNNMSAVIRLQYGQTSFLLTGDASRESEEAMLDSNSYLASDVLLVGHHGSKSSTTPGFLAAVTPKYGIIQVGDNAYGHPTATVLNRLQASGVEVYRNDTQGTIEIKSDGLNYEITTER